MTRNEIISRLRNSLKETSSDSKFTNRYLWNTFWTKALLLLQRESDKPKLYNQSNIWKTICVQMDKVSPLVCDCVSLPMDCVVYRSRYRLPLIAEGSFGLLYRFIASLDLSNFIVLVTPYQYLLKKSKFNKEKYAFIHDGYLWAPDTKWSKLVISGIFQKEISKDFDCDCQDNESSAGDCATLPYLDSGVPDYLIDAAIQMALQELGQAKSIPSDQHPNANENEKQIST